MPDFDSSNIIFQMAADMVNHSSQNIFLTGKAGTGKTTFLRYIKQNCPKQTVVLAPTGVAAINAGGTTIHSFFQLPFSPFIPVNYSQSAASGPTEFAASAPTEVTTTHSLMGRLKFNAEKRKLLQSLELLIIDEISMVRCDMLDEIDTILRHFRNRNREPFGGVQLLMIGDMYQLPPVITDEEWRILSGFYNSPYFFSSRVIRENAPANICFEKIYRQNDEKFINLLNQVRNNEFDEDSLNLLNSLYQPGFKPDDKNEYIILTTHNYKADTINNLELNKLPGNHVSFNAKIDGDFPEKAFPADEILKLKEGAMVMFLRNDSEKVRRYFNGKIGVIIKINDDSVLVKCKDDEEAIEVGKERWENIRYSLNKKTQQIEEEITGSFNQLPLRLAWAITIHKSQGLTFEKAIIDAGNAFAPGQVYVALSRCTTIDGLVLHSRIFPSSLHSDERIHAFSKNTASLPQLEMQLTRARHLYQQSLLKNLFDLLPIVTSVKDVVKLSKENTSSFNPEAVTWSESLLNQLIAINDVAIKFVPRLEQFFLDQTLPDQNAALQERLKASSQYFSGQLNGLLQFLLKCPAVTDSSRLARLFNETVFDPFSLLSEKKFLFEFCKNGFDAAGWHRKKNEFKLPAFTVTAYAGATQRITETPHPALYQQLRKLRDDICNRKQQPIYMVAGSNTLNEMATFLPQNIEELAKISGFGKVKLELYGNDFIGIIQNYCNQHDLPSRIEEKIPKRQRKERSEKKDTKLESFKLYKEGKSVNEIAAIRNFVPQTIEGHLAYFVRKGDIKIDTLVKLEKVNLIEPLVKGYTGSIITIKEKLGDDVSFGEIRFVMAWSEFQKEKENDLGAT